MRATGGNCVEVEGTSITKFLRQENSNPSREQQGRVYSCLWLECYLQAEGRTVGVGAGRSYHGSDPCCDLESGSSHGSHMNLLDIMGAVL